MAQWGTSTESGILRKNKPKENHDDLLVFGYACKLFRDDEKASYVDKGQHLIPWMGDEKLKIDRYDCRGALSDLSPFEASREGFDAMRWLGLNDSERKLEQLCDKERYYSLHINEEEEQMYKEEEQKRQKTNEFQYSYDVPTDPEQEMATVKPEPEEKDEEFVPSPTLDVPVDIAIPKTVKENARIEKTALFVCKQGLQMEILIKTKQANNPQFGFLNQGHDLYKYYRHVLAAIKNGRYQVAAPKKEPADEPQESRDQPSPLPASIEPEVPASVPTVPYKPSANCAYSQLVNRIQGNSQLEPAEPPPPEMTYEQQQQYFQYYYAAQYYEYYKQMAQYQQGNGQGPVQPPVTQLDPAVQTYIQQMAYAQYMQHQNSNPYAQIVSNVKEVSREETKAEEPIETAPLLSLVAYDSEPEEEEESEAEFKVPCGEVQIVIDKMATYVAKNGLQFEEIVKAKGDPRFEFLKETHEFYHYYKSKLQLATEDAATPPKPKEKKVIAPVSFSIKKAKEDGPKEIKSALPVEESDEDSQSEAQVEVAPPTPAEAANAEPEAEPVQKNGIFDADDPLLEMIDLTDDSEERKDARRAEDKIKDKLAAAAREKMVSVARDRALQLERKKKAAAFLKLKSAESGVEEGAKGAEKKEVVQIDDSDEEEEAEETKKRAGKKKKSHKRKHSKSKHDSRRKKSKRKRRRSDSESSSNSKSS